MGNSQTATVDQKISATLNLALGSNLPIQEQGLNQIRKYNILVCGLHHTGKSSFINTIFRVLLKDFDKKLKNFCPVSQSGIGDHMTEFADVIPPPNFSAISFFDMKAPEVSPENNQELEFFKRCIEVGVKKGSSFSHIVDDPNNKIQVCILIISVYDLNNIPKMKRLQQLVETIKLVNRPPIVVLTYGDKLITSEINLSPSEARIKILDRLSVEAPFIIENYISPDNNPQYIPPRNLNTDTVVCDIIEKAIFNGDWYSRN